MINKKITSFIISSLILGLVSCNNNSPYSNLNFEQGNFNNWKVEGDAFSVTDDVYFGDNNRYYFHEGNFHVVGSLTKQGSLKSPTFKVQNTGYISFLISGCASLDTFVGVYDAKSNEEYLKIGNEYLDNDLFIDNYIRQNIDLSAYFNKEIYLMVVDSSVNDYINVDDFKINIIGEELTDLLIEQNVRIGLDTYDDMVKAANTYIKQNSYKIDANNRFKFHVTGEVGWINDPNGFSFYNGKVNLFYQHNPYDIKWGPMHWGHVTSSDFVKWDYQSIALAPDKDYDYVGAFSGSAIEFDGKYYLVYTGASDGKQVQCIAISEDGVNFTKYEGNPVIDEKNLPANTSHADFRDPKVWVKDGVVYMIVSARNSTNQYSKLLLYKSTNMIDWTYAGKVIANNSNMGQKLGIMFECPDIFELGGRSVILVSPQSVAGHRNSDSNVYIVGDLSYNTGSLESWDYEKVEEIDKGFDFYAPQTMLMSDGRRIMVAWMASWNRSPIYSSLGFAGALTFPRELTLVNNHLYQTPVKEIENYYRNEYKQTLQIKGVNEISNLDSFHQDITLEFNPSNGKTGITVFGDELGNGMKVYYQDGKVYLERYGVTTGYYSQSELFNVTSANAPLVNGKVKIRLILDRYSCEVFIADGFSTITATGFPKSNQNHSFLFSDNNTNISIIKHDVII